MNFNLTDEQRMLEDTVGRLVRDAYGFDKREQYRKEALGFSTDMWRTFAELGLLAVTFAEDFGGFDGGGQELMVVAEGLGRGLVVEPYHATVVLSGTAIKTLGNAEQQEQLLGAIASGEARFALALYEPESFYDATHINTTAEKTASGYRLNGKKAVVLHGDSADQLVVVARTSGTNPSAEGLSVFVVPADAEGVSRRGYPTIDGLQGADIVLNNVEVGADALLGEEGKGWAGIEQAINHGIVALCAEAVGAMEVACDQTLQYLKEREQFGVVIGQFQALQHRMVDMRMALEKTRSLTMLAASSLEESDELRNKRLHAAKAMVGKAGALVAEEAIQLYGGMGMMDETPVAHYAKRIVMIDHLLGDKNYHLQKLSSLLDVDEEAS